VTSNTLVFGAAGFIGRALVKQLLDEGYKVTAIDRCWIDGISGADCIGGDVFDPTFLRSVINDNDVVYHLVSTTIPSTSNKDPVYDCESNIMGTLHMLDTMVECGVRKVVFASSGGTVYGVPKVVPILESAETYPICAYGISKLAIERYLHLYSNLYGIQAVVLRISNPFGPGQLPEKGLGAIATFAKRALHGETIEIWGDGSVIRDFIYIDDVVDALIASEQTSEPFTLLNIGSGQGKSLLEVLAVIERELGDKIAVSFQPSRACDVPEVVLDIQKAKSVLGWQPKHSFEEGMKKLIAHMKSQVTTN